MNTQTANPVVTQFTIKQRLLALVDLLLEDSRFDKITSTIIRNLARNFMSDKVTEDDLRAQIIKVRDEFIPVILGEEPRIVDMERKEDEHAS